jgi:hypothetical protein
VITVDDPHVAAVKRLIELAGERGFVFTPAGKDGALSLPAGPGTCGVSRWSVPEVGT